VRAAVEVRGMKHLLLIAAIACSSSSAPHEGLVGWLGEWERARSCLVGNVEHLDDLGTALRIRQLERRSCRVGPPPIVAALDPDTAERWGDVSARITSVLDATDVSDLAPAIQQIDRDIAELRLEAGLPELERGRSSAIALLEGGRMISVGGRAVTDREIVSYAPVTARLIRGDTNYEVTYEGTVPRAIGRAFGRAPRVVAHPSGTWTVTSTNRFGSVPVTSDPERRLDDIPSWRHPTFATDSGPYRLIVHGGDSGAPFAISISRDGGATWGTLWGPQDSRYVGASQDPIEGTIHVFSRDVDATWVYAFPRESLAEIVAQHRLPEPMRVPGEGAAGVDCRGARTLWARASNGVVRIGNPMLFSLEPRRLKDPIADVRCNDDIAVTLRRDPDVLDRCVAGGCGPVLELSSNVRGAMAMLSNGTWIYAASSADVVGIWREGAKPRFYRLAAPGPVKGIPVFAGVPHLAIGTAAGVRFVRVP
jgi:hypothetical protein